MKLAAKTFTALVAVAALALAGCGGDDDSTTVTGPGGGTATVRTDDLTPQQKKRIEQLEKRAEQRKQSGSGNLSSTVEFRQPSGSAPTSSGSLPNEGTRRVAPGVPTARGGDNSIQEFGVEGSSSERVQASQVLQAYLDARLDGEWALACSYLADPVKKQLAQSGGQAARGGQSLDCAQVMRAFTQGAPREALRNAADINVLSMRVRDGQAFLLYRDGEGTPTAISMNEESGAWKVAAIAGSALFLGV